MLREDVSISRRTLTVGTLLALFNLPGVVRADQKQEGAIRGKLIYAQGTLQSYDLASGKIETVLTEGMLWPSLSLITDTRLLVSLAGQIFDIDIVSKARQVVGRGYNAQYIAETGQVLYLRPLGGPRPGLFVGDLAHLEESSRRIGEDVFPLAFVAQILPGPVAIFSSSTPQDTPWRYDFRTGKLERIAALRGKVPLAWRSATAQLLTVVNERSPAFILSDEWGGNQERLDGLENGLPALYIAGYDACVVNMRVSTLFSVERADLFWFPFKSRKLVRLHEYMTLPAGKFVFVP